MVKAVHIITRLDFGGAQGNTLYTAAHLDRARFDDDLRARADYVPLIFPKKRSCCDSA